MQRMLINMDLGYCAKSQVADVRQSRELRMHDKEGQLTWGSAKHTVHGGTHHVTANATEKACNPDPGSAIAPAACDLTKACIAELSSVPGTVLAGRCSRFRQKQVQCSRMQQQTVTYLGDCWHRRPASMELHTYPTLSTSRYRKCWHAGLVGLLGEDSSERDSSEKEDTSPGVHNRW